MEYEKPIPSGASMKSSDALRLHLVGFKLIFPVVVNPSVRNGPSSLNAPIVAAHGGPPLNQMISGRGAPAALSCSTR